MFLFINNYILKHRPDIKVCDDCNTDMTNDDLVKINKDSHIFCISIGFKCNVFYAKCSKCAKCFFYDGMKDGIFNPNDNCLIYHDLFDMYENLKRSYGISQKGFVRMIQMLYYNNNSCVPFLSSTWFTQLYEMYYFKQRWDNKLECKPCKKENRMPRIIASDCTSLLLKQNKCKSVITPSDTTQFNEVKVKMKEAVEKICFSYLNTKTLR